VKNKIQIRRSSEKIDITRLRPERIEVGECTEMETSELLQVMGTKYGGYIISSMAPTMATALRTMIMV